MGWTFATAVQKQRLERLGEADTMTNEVIDRIISVSGQRPACVYVKMPLDMGLMDLYKESSRCSSSISSRSSPSTYIRLSEQAGQPTSLVTSLRTMS